MALINQYAMVFVYLLLVLQVLDALTTLYVLRKGTGVEGNPFMRKLMEFFWPRAWNVVAKDCICRCNMDIPCHHSSVGVCCAVRVLRGDCAQQHAVCTEGQVMWINRTMIVPAEHVDLTRALAEGISGPAGAGMWTTGLSADGTEPATHYISAGLIEDTFADLLPLTMYDADGVATTAPGQADVIAAQAEVDVAVIEALLAAVTVTDEPAMTTMSRMGLVMVVPAETPEVVE